MMKVDYTIKIKAMINGITAAGLDRCYIVRIGNDRDCATLSDPIIQAQTELCNTYAKAVLVSTKFSGMAAAGLMKDQFHYTQAGYNATGADAGIASAVHVTSRITEAITFIVSSGVHLSIEGVMEQAGKC
ncbi:hypothetical protein FHS18_000143 [Paenibacillus phyllosphaerae]|uniref:Uncharacterized protein n=1 Tax=Paenibacillus phyllosphaerae TaxID=274593 RepID=A0A7W5FKF7_9BACL|nr:hypothetical protein [Paenibacillus phyllosphaerae]MBB3108115.1 hypothetical protein [Paenibacillus phyllosphaerae]